MGGRFQGSFGFDDVPLLEYIKRGLWNENGYSMLLRKFRYFEAPFVSSSSAALLSTLNRWQISKFELLPTCVGRDPYNANLVAEAPILRGQLASDSIENRPSAAGTSDCSNILNELLTMGLDFSLHIRSADSRISTCWRR